MNLQTADARNQNDAKAIHGITKFSDLTEPEFKKLMLGIDNAILTTTQKPPSGKTKTKPSPEMLAFVDWTGVYTTPIKDQGYCGR